MTSSFIHCTQLFDPLFVPISLSRAGSLFFSSLFFGKTKRAKCHNLYSIFTLFWFETPRASLKWIKPELTQKPNYNIKNTKHFCMHLTLNTQDIYKYTTRTHMCCRVHSLLLSFIACFFMWFYYSPCSYLNHIILRKKNVSRLKDRVTIWHLFHEICLPKIFMVSKDFACGLVMWTQNAVNKSMLYKNQIEWSM